MAELKPGNLKTYRGNLSLDWYGKNYSIVQGVEGDNVPGMVPPPKLNWVNDEGSAFYLPQDDKKPVWIHRGDIRVHEARPLVHQKSFTTTAQSASGTLGMEGDQKFQVIESETSPASRPANLLIKGDNLLALNTLKKDYTGQVKCIFIDPPYNTGSAFEHYDDNLEHSVWLTLMRDRLQLLRTLLTNDGFLCCHIDDAEGPYLKVLLDEVFGRENYLTTLFVQVRYPEKTLKQDMDFHKEIEHVHIYRNGSVAKPTLQLVKSSFEKFNFYFREKAGGREISLGGKKVVIFSKDEYEIEEREGGPGGRKEIWATGTILDGNSSGRFFRDYLAGRETADGLGTMYKVYGIGDDNFDFRYFTGPKKASATKGKYFQGVPTSQVDQPGKELEIPIENFYDLAGSFGNCRHEGGVEFRGGKKPEVYLEIILKHFSLPGDLVLDSFGGSGTTGAVAHKMGRRWIMVEQGDHCDTHIVPRMKKVLSGEDQGGVSAAQGWKGGGSFSYYHLGDSLLKVDENGWADLNWAAGRTWLEGAILSAYNFTPVSLEGGTIHEDGPVAGVRKIKGGAEVALVSLVAPGESPYREMLGRREWDGLYAAAKRLGNKIFLFTNRGLELAAEAKPDDLTVIRVPEALVTQD